MNEGSGGQSRWTCDGGAEGEDAAAVSGAEGNGPGYILYSTYRAGHDG